MNATFWLVGIAIVACVWWISKMVQQQRVNRRYNVAYNSGAVGAVVGYWSAMLKMSHPDLKRETQKRFEERLRQRLAWTYAHTERFPTIGVFYYAPHHYGADPVLWDALDAAQLVHFLNRDIAHNHFRGDGTTRISLDVVTLKPCLMGDELKFLWPPHQANATEPAAAAEALA